MDTPRNVGRMRKRMGSLFSRIRRRFRESISAVDLCSATQSIEVEKIDKNMQTYLHGLIGNQFNFKTFKTDASISKLDSGYANSNCDCQDNSKNSNPQNKPETEASHTLVVPAKSTDSKPRNCGNGQGDNAWERFVKENNLPNFGNIDWICTVENLATDDVVENHTEAGSESKDVIIGNTRLRTTSRFGGMLSRLKLKSKNYEEVSHSPKLKQKKKTRSVATSPRVKYGDKATQTNETYTPDELITYNTRGEVTYIKSKFHPVRTLKGPRLPKITKPGFIDPNPQVLNVPNRKESVRAKNSAPENSSANDKRTEYPKQPSVSYNRENDLRVRMLKVIGEPDTVKILERLHKNCKDTVGGALVHVINTAVSQFKRHYEKFSEEERRNVAKQEENFISNLKTEIHRLGRVVSNDTPGAHITVNAPSFLSEDAKDQESDKKQHKRTKSRKRAPKSVDANVSGETAETQIQENIGSSSHKATNEDNTNIPGAAKHCQDVNAANKTETDPMQAAKLSNMCVNEFGENGNVYTYDEDNNVWNPENKRKMYWHKRHNAAPSVVSGSNASSTVPYMDISEGFDRGSHYRMDGHQVVGKCRRGFKTDIRPQKVKRRGIPNKHLTSANAYLQEDAVDLNVQITDESNNSGTELEFNKEVVRIESRSIENEVADAQQKEEVTSEIITEQPEEEDNRHLVSEPSNIFLRKKGECDDLQEKYSVAKTSKSKGNKQRKKRNATRKVNLISVNTNNNADDDMSDEDEDDDDDDDEEDMFDDDKHPLLCGHADVDDAPYQFDYFFMVNP